VNTAASAIDTAPAGDQRREADRQSAVSPSSCNRVMAEEARQARRFGLLARI